jgi:hypothetical protein
MRQLEGLPHIFLLTTLAVMLKKLDCPENSWRDFLVGAGAVVLNEVISDFHQLKGEIND